MKKCKQMKEKKMETEYITGGKNVIDDININTYYHGLGSKLEI
jgi:hypothetical protein